MSIFCAKDKLKDNKLREMYKIYFVIYLIKFFGLNLHQVIYLKKIPLNFVEGDFNLLFFTLT
jgi:hypothetical protein